MMTATIRTQLKLNHTVRSKCVTNLYLNTSTFLYIAAAKRSYASWVDPASFGGGGHPILSECELAKEGGGGKLAG